ncbi:MAG: hypothetical protein KIH89_003985 [Candidatus Shapirobacteria bacterium]|nr:hypothetical protein [Candidatus Shapirobacteria bacterium]
MAIKKELSLLPDSDNPNSFNARFIKWATTVGRWVMTLTELIVISAFLSRFWLDRKNSDLSDLIRQKQAILESTQEFESEFLSLQKRLTFIKSSYSQTQDYSSKINSLVSSTPQGLIYQDLSILVNPITKKINANANITAFSEDSVIDFISNLMSNSDIENVKINQIEKKPKENNYTISLSVIFKNLAKKT